MVEEGDSSEYFYSSLLFPRLSMVCETMLDSGALVCIFKDQILLGENYATCIYRFVRTANGAAVPVAGTGSVTLPCGL